MACSLAGHGPWPAAWQVMAHGLQPSRAWAMACSLAGLWGYSLTGLWGYGLAGDGPGLWGYSLAGDGPGLWGCQHASARLMRWLVANACARRTMTSLSGIAITEVVPIAISALDTYLQKCLHTWPHTYLQACLLACLCRCPRTIVHRGCRVVLSQQRITGPGA